MIQTVVNALRLLEAFGADDEFGVTELSRRLNLHKNNVFRLLATLEQRGYIEQNAETERYRLGLRCVELCKAFSRSHSLLGRGRPVLRSLAAKVGETAHLAVMISNSVAHVDAEVYDQPIMSPARIGAHLPLHCTALGKVLLGLSSEACRKAFDLEVVAGRSLERRTPSTIVDPLKLFEQLRTVAGQGFAVDIEECEPGLNCAAGPVYDRSGEIVAALSVSGPSFRVGTERLHSEIVPLVTRSADDLSRSLGFCPGIPPR